MSRYLEIARSLSDLITAGSLRPGDPIPSIRQASAQHRVGNGTVVQAYGVLEARGLIESRPRSGYYVRQARGLHELPEVALRRPTIVEGNNQARLHNILGDLTASKTTFLGSSFVDPSLFPLQTLKKELIASMKDPSFSAPLQDSLLGLPRLRRAIAQRYLELGYAVPTDEIIITNGGMEAIYLALKAVTKPGDLVLIDSPMYFAGLQLLEQLYLRTVEVPTNPSDGLDLGQLDKTLHQHKVAACLLMTNCHNPLGFSISEDKKTGLVKLLEKHQVPLIENDVYTELQFDLRHIRAAKAFDRSGLVLHCGSFTKSLAPGYQIGWLATGKFRERVVRLKFVTTFGTNTPTQAAIAHYMQYGSYDRHLRKLRGELQSRLASMTNAVEKHFPVGTRHTQPTGGYVLWIQLPQAVDAFALFDLAATSNVGIAPGPIFSASRGYQNFIRLNCSRAWTPAMDKTIGWLGHQVKRLM